MRIRASATIVCLAITCGLVFAQDGIVSIKLTGDNKFDPDKVEVDPKKDKTIQFVCVEGTHDVTIDDGKGGQALFKIAKITPKDKPFEVAVNDLVKKAGGKTTLRYVCKRHEARGMVGQIVLKK